MSIVLRINKGSALTYDEMDKNQSQFYYSSSLNGTNELRLHLSGSAGLGAGFNTRYDSIFLPVNTETTTTTTTAAGDSTQIQFNDNDAFAADSVFVFKSGSNFQGIGTGDPQARLHIKGDSTIGARIRLEGVPATGNDRTTSHQSTVDFYNASELLGYVGRINTDDSIKNLDITNRSVYNLSEKSYGKININVNGPNSGLDDINNIGTFSFDNDIKSFGIGTDSPDRNISVVGNEGIGISSTGNTSLASYISPIPNSLYSETDGSNRKRLVPDNSAVEGLLISSPNAADGGNVVIAINTDNSAKEGFNVIKSKTGQYTEANTSVLLSAKVDGTVGINTNFATDVGLTVAGVISGSGNADFGGNLTAEGTATIGSVADDGTSYTDISSVGVTSTGLVKKLDAIAAPIPVGGIIIWSGAANAIPTGWALCDGSTVSGSLTPNLVNRFVVGATDTYSVGASGGNSSVTLTSGSIPEMTTTSTSKTLTGSVTRVSETFNDGGTVTGIFSKTTGFSEGNSPDNVDPSNTGKLEIDATHTHTVGESSPSAVDIRPPYYALCYIMYVGI